MISGDDRTRPAQFPGGRPPRRASTFPDQRRAERVLDGLLNHRDQDLAEWMELPDRRLALRDTFKRRVGRSLDGGTMKVSRVRGVHAVLCNDPSMPEGWRIHTAYPVPSPTASGVETPALAHLIGAYFHQDWAEDHTDQFSAVEVFMAESPSHVATIPEDVARVLDLDDERAISEHLDSLGCEFTLLEGETYADWLNHVAARCAAAAN